MATNPTSSAPTDNQTDGTGTQRVVLISIDHSEHAERAFEYYVNNLHQAENKILCLHISEPPYLTEADALMGASTWEMRMAEERASAKELEKKYEAKLQEHHLSGHIKTMSHTRPGEIIVSEAAKEHVGMVVMGTRGLGAIRRTILGSVSDYVLHHVHCPVVIYRQ